VAVAVVLVDQAFLVVALLEEPAVLDCLLIFLVKQYTMPQAAVVVITIKIVPLADQAALEAAVEAV
jgi:hypothetical protein